MGSFAIVAGILAVIVKLHGPYGSILTCGRKIHDLVSSLELNFIFLNIDLNVLLLV